MVWTCCTAERSRDSATSSEEILSGESGRIIWSWLKELMGDRRIDELIAKWIGVKIGEKTDNWTDVRIDRLIGEKITDRTLEVNSVGLIG
jgi:hypothetical protein